MLAKDDKGELDVFCYDMSGDEMKSGGGAEADLTLILVLLFLLARLS